MGKIRIIGGIHRSRQLTVLDANGLRPTLDRVKETLFNWLGQDLTGLNCLDAFSGSGSLGFEAISRNAKSVIMIELEQRVYQQLVTNQKLLNVNNCQIIHGNATEFLKTTNLVFDVIFLDPPYNSNLLTKILPLARNKLNSNGYIYAEYQHSYDFADFTIVKHGKAGVVNYVLLQVKD